MTEFYQWAINNFASFIAVTAVFVGAAVVIIYVAKWE